MQKFNDISPKNRLLKVLIALTESPNRYTKVDLATQYNVHKDTIKEDIEDIRNAGFQVTHDKQYRYAIVQDKVYEHLKELLFFSENEQGFILDVLEKTNHADKRYERVRKKLENIHDISKIGSSMITKPFLTKINLLEKAKASKFLVKLVGYRSTNSSDVTDRLVEPFQISHKEDMLHSFDVEKKDIRHFRLSRIERVEVVEVPWTYEGKHHVKATDPFRIVDDKQVSVHIRMKVGGLNEITERFPLTSAYLKPAADEAGLYDLECKVNHRFYGLSNFILGHHRDIVEILEPESLLEHIQKEVEKIKF
jgi:predicted DNA-binding transcriptional regulator YafY